MDNKIEDKIKNVVEKIGLEKIFGDELGTKMKNISNNILENSNFQLLVSSFVNFKKDLDKLVSNNGGDKVVEEKREEKVESAENNSGECHNQENANGCNCKNGGVCLCENCDCESILKNHHC